MRTRRSSSSWRTTTGAGGSNNQHPGNNLIPNDAYDTYDDTDGGDFERGEQLIASVYETLRSNPAVFERTRARRPLPHPGQLPEPRRGVDLPDLSHHLPPTPVTREAMLAAEAAPAGPELPVPDYYRDFVKLAELVAAELPPTAEVGAQAAPDLGPRARAHQVTVAFTHHADRARTPPPRRAT